MTKRLVTAVLLTLLGAGILASYFLANNAWKELDAAIFYFFNAKLVPGSRFGLLVAYTNVRAFDAISFIAMGLLYYYYFRRADNAGRRLMICLGVCMLLTGVLIKQCSGLIPIKHPSPTYFFDGANRVGDLVDFPVKSGDRNSFPGDHGMMLMVFAAFMARYFGRRTFGLAALLAVIFAMPRIMAGAHWFSDVYMGSLSIACMVVSWILLTPASDRVAALLERLMPAWFFPVGGSGMFGGKNR
ncbi:MAG: phosphatase PAP2 family protein [Deltaproteobacteria bacterium]|nr:phosphatase PAP2 family protein [Deltaproteobacteria bacterium]